MNEPPDRVRVYCNAPTILTIGGGERSMILRQTTNGRVWAYRIGDRYLCEACGKLAPVAW